MLLRRIRRALRVGGLAGGVLAVVGLVDHALIFPLVFASLGPTAYQLIYDPSHEQSKVGHAGLAHLLAAFLGLGSLAAFGLWHQPNILQSGVVSFARVGAVTVGLGATLAILELLGFHHAPAGATNMLVTTGFAAPWKLFLGLLSGVGLLLVLLFLLSLVPWVRAGAELLPPATAARGELACDLAVNPNPRPAHKDR